MLTFGLYFQKVIFFFYLLKVKLSHANCKQLEKQLIRELQSEEKILRGNMSETTWLQWKK